jgi:ferredoxin
MDYEVKTEKQLGSGMRRIVDRILDIKEPPVARCRLLSRGIEPYHRLNTTNDVLDGDCACIACGNCIDSCPVLRREPARRGQTVQRTSFALESIVGEDCEQCYSCVLACPQVDTNIKDYVVDERVVEVIPESKRLTRFDPYIMTVVALIFGIIIGVFIAR